MDYKCSVSTARRLFIGPQDFLYSHMWSVSTSLSLPFSFLPSMKDKVSFDLVFLQIQLNSSLFFLIPALMVIVI